MTASISDKSSSEILNNARNMLEKIRAQSARSNRRMDRNLTKTARLEDKILELNKFWIDHERKVNDSFLNKAFSLINGQPQREIKRVKPFAKRPVEKLSLDALFLIFKLLRYSDLTAASQVCRRWRVVTESNLFCRKEMRKYFPALCDSDHTVFDLAKGFRPCIPLAVRFEEDKKAVLRIEGKGAIIISVSMITASLSLRLLAPHISNAWDKFAAFREARLEEYLKEIGMTREAYMQMLDQQYYRALENYQYYY